MAAMIAFARILGFGALCLASCGNRGGGSAVGPPEPASIDMNGTWAIAVVERSGSSAPLPTPSPVGLPLLPVVSGQAIEIAAGAALAPDHQPLFLELGGAIPQRYTNVADGRTFRLDIATAWTTICASSLAMRASFSPVDDDTMIGFLEVQYASDCAPSLLDHEPNGVFLVQLVRMAEPAAGITETR